MFFTGPLRRGLTAWPDSRAGGGFSLGTPRTHDGQFSELDRDPRDGEPGDVVDGEVPAEVDRGEQGARPGTRRPPRTARRRP